MYKLSFLIFNFVILFSVIYESSVVMCSLRDKNIAGSIISYQLRDKIYEAIRIFEINLFYNKRDNSKIVKVIDEIFGILKSYLLNSCNNETGTCKLVFSNNGDNIDEFFFNDFDFGDFAEIIYLIEFVNDFNPHQFTEGIFQSLHPDKNISNENNFCNLHQFKEDFVDLIKSVVSGQNLVFVLNKIYNKLKIFHKYEDNMCRYGEIRKKILKIDKAFGSTLASYRILERAEEIFRSLHQVYLSVKSKDYKKLGYSIGKIFAHIYDLY